ncbi:MAG: VanZ family protein [Acidobacteriota bacterium]
MRFAPALLLTGLIVGTAPFLGKLQKVARDRVDSDRLVLFLTAFFVVSGIGISATLLVRWLRERGDQEAPRRPGAWLWVVAGAVLVGAQILLSERGSASAAAYERLHFILYGLLAILLYRAFTETCSQRWSALGAAAGVLTASLLDEGVQWLVPLRTGEFFDLGLNLYGGVAGLLAAQALPARPAEGRTDARPVVVLVAIALLGLLLFVDRAHLGHRIEDPEIGTFHSFHTAVELASANEDRRRRWADDMPQLPLRTALAVEDYFLTEAGWHVLLRNRARADGDPEIVWHETRILERFYPATLEIPDGDWFRYRLPEVERAELERVTPREGYWSPADNGRIWLWPRWVLLVAVVVVALLVGALWRAAQSQPSRVSSIS